MDIILVKDIPNLGSLGDEVQVKNGYARNYLLPKGLAMPATSSSLAKIRHQRALLQKARHESIGASNALRDRLMAEAWVLHAKSGTGGRLFGSVTTRDLLQMLTDRGYALERKTVRLPAPIKTLGSHVFHVRLHTEVKVDLNVQVKAEQDPSNSKEAKVPPDTKEAVAVGEALTKTAGSTTPETSNNTA